MRSSTAHMFLAAIALSATLLGCRGKSHSIVGTWDIKGGPTAATFTFAADGNFKAEAVGRGRSSTRTGQYTLTGDKLDFNAPHSTATIKWNSDDEMVMTGDDGRAMTLTKRK